MGGAIRFTRRKRRLRLPVTTFAYQQAWELALAVFG
jgi:hypothetical protein